ncbi:hypothetical protein SLEP1_g6615 [Rubroshorea leprosula]|uniref:Uncharacterized protein n=1 Tax=Rubroshorea leprosula TaxID=152421 RepID=A0AAV5I0D1_9ROSI|nr:hypothetical protein SLEP1_g6615 [Rubroshorea leprosula]
MATDPSASSFLLILAFVDGVGTPLSSSLSEFFDVFYLPYNVDGKFVVKKGGKVVFPLGSAKVFCDLDKVSWVTSSFDVNEIYKENLDGFIGGINTLAILSCSTKIEKLKKVDRAVKTEKILAEKVEKAASKSKGVVPQGAPPVVRRSKRLKSASFKVASASGSDKEGRLLISSFIDFIVGKSFSKPLTRSPLKDAVRPSYDIGIEGPSIIGHSSIACESSKSMLLADAGEEQGLLNLCRQLHFEKTALGANSSEVERLKKELIMLQECYDLLKKEKELFSSSVAAKKVSLESFILALQRRLGDLSSANFALERSVLDLRVQVSSLQASSSSIVQSFKESLEGRAFALSGSLGYFNLAVKLIKMLLSRHGLNVFDCLAEFEDMDVVALIHVDPELKKTYDRGTSVVFLDDSPREASEGIGSSWVVGDSTIAVCSRDSFVDAKVSQGASSSPPA